MSRCARVGGPSSFSTRSKYATGEPLASLFETELHATEYLLKPVGRDHLISVVSDYCEPMNW